MTDGTEHRGESAAPAQHPGTPASPGTPATPGAYGYPQPPEVPNPESGYGYPRAGNPYAQPQPPNYAAPAQPQSPSPFPPSAFQQPQQAQPQPPFANQAPPQPFASASEGPNWEALADRNESQSRRKKRMLTIGIVVVACLLGVGAGVLVLGGFGKDKGKPVAGPSTSASATGSAKASPSSSGAAQTPSNSPTVPGQPNLLADHSGQSNVVIGPDAQINPVTDGFALRFKSDSNSFAQSASPVIDVTKSFSVSAWVENEATDGPRMAISQGDGVSYSFELGRDDAGGQKNWVFRVQTADGGNDSSAVQAVTGNVNTVGQWALLTGVYDANAHSIALYVNGQVAQTTPIPNNGSVWAGPGATQFGRSREHNQWGGMWAGVIGHILVWNQALNPAQAADLKNGGTGQAAKPIASWLIG